MVSRWAASRPGGALSGMRVVDLSEQLPGPYATFLLADLGASVVKVEPPGGDVARSVDPPMYATLSSRKRVIELDLKTDRGRAELYALVGEADVVVAAWRPGVAARLGADPEFLSSINPSLIYCSVSGYGSTGPLAARSAHDLNVQALVGAVEPQTRRVGVPWVDLAAGAMVALAVSAAWRGGQSGWIDYSMLDVAASWAAIKPEALTDIEPLYGTVVTGDGHLFAVTALEDAVWRRLCAALGWDDWRDDPDLDSPGKRRAAAPRLRARLDEAVAALDGAGLAALAQSADLPFTAIEPRDPAAQEQLALRSAVRPLDSHVPVPAAWPG